jgi:predicted lipid-binding transport protein (Tim44 family)
MSKDEPFLSDHEQRVLAEIEKNLAAEDPDFVRNVSEAKPRKNTSRLLGLGILGLLVGIGLLLFNTTHFALGVLGFLLMLVSVVGIVKSIRDRAAVGRSPSSMFRDAWRRAEERMRSRRRDQQ